MSTKIDIPEGAAVSAVNDGNREIRSMILAALPCPPLPIMVTSMGNDGDTASESSSGNSHDLISHLMNVRAACDQELVNSSRLDAQNAAHKQMFAKFDSLAQQKNLYSPGGVGANSKLMDEVYSYFCEFTREYVRCFLDGGWGENYGKMETPDLRMPPMWTVVNGGPVHRVAVQHALAQDRIFGPCKAWAGKKIPDLSYPELIALSASRIMDAAP